MKNFALFTFFVLIFKLSVCQNDNDMNQTIYQFKVKDITGKTFDFENISDEKWGISVRFFLFPLLFGNFFFYRSFFFITFCIFSHE